MTSTKQCDNNEAGGGFQALYLNVDMTDRLTQGFIGAAFAAQKILCWGKRETRIHGFFQNNYWSPSTQLLYLIAYLRYRLLN